MRLSKFGLKCLKKSSGGLSSVFVLEEKKNLGGGLIRVLLQ